MLIITAKLLPILLLLNSTVIYCVRKNVFISYSDIWMTGIGFGPRAYAMRHLFTSKKFFHHARWSERERKNPTWFITAARGKRAKSTIAHESTPGISIVVASKELLDDYHQTRFFSPHSSWKSASRPSPIPLLWLEIQSRPLLLARPWCDSSTVATKVSCEKIYPQSAILSWRI